MPSTWSRGRFQSRTRTTHISSPRRLFAARQAQRFISISCGANSRANDHTSSPRWKALRILFCSLSAKASLMLLSFISLHFVSICASVGSSFKEARRAIRARERLARSLSPKYFSQILFVWVINMLTFLCFELEVEWYLFRQLAPLFFRDIFEFCECILAKVDTPPVCMTGECAIHNWFPIWVPMIVLLIQPEEQPWPPGLRCHEGVMVEVPMEEVPIGMCRSRSFSNPCE